MPSQISKWPLLTYHHFRNGLSPSSTTQCCFGKLLNEFYNTPKKSKIHLNTATTQCCFGKLLNKFYYIPKKSKTPQHRHHSVLLCYVAKQVLLQAKEIKIHFNIATTQFCFGKLLNEFYYTAKKS